MDQRLAQQFLFKVHEQCGYFLQAFAPIEADWHRDEMWGEVQTALTAAANVSKLLWGQSGKYAADRQFLREALQVEDSSPLRPTTMRNHFEHIDERLDDWWAKSERHNILDANWGSREYVAGVNEVEVFRFYDPTTHDLWFWGSRLNLYEVAAEIRRIFTILETTHPIHPRAE